MEKYTGNIEGIKQKLAICQLGKEPMTSAVFWATVQQSKIDN